MSIMPEEGRGGFNVCTRRSHVVWIVLARDKVLSLDN
jgi:hypothetical protein